MNRYWKILLFSGLVLLLVAGAVLAAPNGFSIDWWTVDGGGGTSEGGDYALSGSIGQPDAGPVMTGGEYTVSGGYWAGVSQPFTNTISLPVVMR